MKYQTKKVKIVGILMLTISWLLLSSCEKDPANPNPGGGTGNNELQLSKEAQGASQTGWQVFNSISTQEQFSDLVSGKDDIVEDAPGMINSIKEVQQQVRMMNRVTNYAHKSNALQKSSGDSLIWYEEWTDPISGTSGRRGLVYDEENQCVRLYETIYQFPAQVQLQYDSTEIAAFVGPSLEDSTDDQLKNVSKLSLFESGYVVEKVVSRVEITDYAADNEPTGFSASNHTTYGPQTELRELNQSIDFRPNGNGTLAERLDYSDGTSLNREVRFYPNNTGDFSETWRDGSTVNGSFDLLEDDNHAAVNLVINFADNPILRQIEQSAEYTLDPHDSSSHGVLSEKIYFTNGATDTSRIEVESYFDGYWKEHYIIYTSNEGHSDFLLTYFDTHAEVEGEHITVEGNYIQFNATYYPDGSGEAWLSVYESEQAYQNGDDPLMTLHIIFNSDGSGKGTITEGGTTYEVRYKSGGEIVVDDNNGKAVSFSGY